LFVISPNIAKAFAIAVVKRTKKCKSADVTGRQIKTEGLFKIPLVDYFGNHRWYDQKTSCFQSDEYVHGL